MNTHTSAYLAELETCISRQPCGRARSRRRQARRAVALDMRGEGTPHLQWGGVARGCNLHWGGAYMNCMLVLSARSRCRVRGRVLVPPQRAARAKGAKLYNSRHASYTIRTITITIATIPRYGSRDCDCVLSYFCTVE